MNDKGDSEKPNGVALLPFAVFAAFYVGLSLFAGHLGFEMPWYKVSMPVAFLVASAASLVLWRRRSLEEKVETYARGMGDQNIMVMCLIFILAGAFATIAKGSGAVDAAVAIAQRFVPAQFMVAGVFLVSCLISLAIGTSCGTIAAVTPIALGFAGPLQLSPALLMGAAVGGAMFGDNMSMISDTTIAATRTQGVRMKDKFLANGSIASPAALVALFLYALSGSAAGSVETAAVTWQHFVLVLPYVFVLALALAGFNVMALLFFGTLLAAVIGGALGRFAFFDAMDLLGKGALGMGETLIVALLAGGLFRSVRENGGIAWLTDRIAKVIRGPRSCELGVFLLVGAVNCFTANNTVAIVIAGPIAKECAEKFKVAPVRIASILDTASCVVQGLIPYGAQILIAMGVARGLDISVDTLSLVKSLYYQPLLALAVLLSMLKRRGFVLVAAAFVAASAMALPAAERDLFADTWDAMDALGRKIGDASTLPAPRKKQVGIFYWTWHQGQKGPVLDNTELLAADPTLPQRPKDPKWGLRMTHYWGRPAFGYYATTDAWVLRRHAQLLSHAGVDVVVFDSTNGTFTWMDSLWTLARTWSEMRAQGVPTPQFAYMLPFWSGEYQATSLLQLYRDLYKPGKYRELWFLWNGKPLVHACPDLLRERAKSEKTPPDDRRDLAEILEFFTFRPLQPAYAVGPTAPDQWCWLEVYPQHPYGVRPDGSVEMCAAGVAQNHSWKTGKGERGLAAMNDVNVFGRAYVGPSADELKPGETLRFAPDRNPHRGEPNRFLWGDNFAQQLAHARKVDPDYLFVTGWNEFIAGNFDVWQGKEGAFPDQYSPEFSRDIEPSDGILLDHFYCQFVDGVRRFKGVRPQRSAAHGPVFRDAIGDVDRRDADGYGTTHYTDDTGRNDIVECFVSHDADFVEFTAECAAAVSPRTDPAWMRLFISVRLDANDPSPHWNHLHFIVNRVTPPDDHTAVLERCLGGWRWEEAARVAMKVDGRRVSVRIPRKAIGQSDRIDVRFKWADNTVGSEGDGNILDFYRHGDAAPDGRFLYRYFE